MSWRHKDEWKQDGDGFCVVVSRHSEQPRHEPACYDSEGPHRWCVYAYIYPKHRLFPSFDASKPMWQQPSLGMHGGVSLFKAHRKNDGEICSYQVGCDYNHDGDWQYTQYATFDEARDVFADAEEIVKSLSEPPQ